MKRYGIAMLIITLLLTSCLSGPVPTPDFSDPENGFPSELIEQIDTHVAQKLDGTPPLAGLVVAVNDGQHPVFIKAYGYANIEAAELTQRDTAYYIGSISKTFTAAAILKLVEEKKLTLDDTVTWFFPDLPGTASQITMQQLLNHTSGLPDDHTLGTHIEVDLDAAYTSEELLALAWEMFEKFDTPPGEAFLYSNAGYTLLALIIEHVSGLSYSTYLEQEIFQPLGLTSTRHCVIPPDNVAQGYQTMGETLTPVDAENMTLLAFGAGSLCSTARDLILWQHALANGCVIKPFLHKKMIAPLTSPDNEPEMAYGLGMQLYREGDTIVSVGHGGSVQGFLSNLQHYVEQDLTVVVLTNTFPPMHQRDVIESLTGLIQFRHAQHFGASR